MSESQSPFSAVPQGPCEAKATEVVVEESGVLTQVLTEILGWFFSNKGKHRDLMLQSHFADAFAIDANLKNTNQNLLTIQSSETYQYRHNPSIVIKVGSIQQESTGLGIAIEHSRAGNSMGALQKRSYSKYEVRLLTETSSKQTTDKLAKLISDIFLLHLPEYYQNVVVNNEAQAQIIFPRKYEAPTSLTKDFQTGANVERVYQYVLTFTVEFETIRFIKGFDKLSIVNGQGGLILKHDLPATIHMGKSYIITIKTNVEGVKLYSLNPAIFDITQVSGVHGTTGDRTYRGVALRTGSFKLRLEDIHRKYQVETDHKATF